MVEYDYRDLFYQQHQRKDFLIVDAGATVTIVSGEEPTVTGATVEIHTADMKAESFQLDESVCPEENLKFGLCESAKVEFIIENKTEIPNLSDYGDFLNIYMYFNGDSDTLFQIGQYICYKDEYTNNRRQRRIELYDAMFTLNDLDITSWYNTYFSDGLRHEIIFAVADLFKWIRGDSPYNNDKSSPKIDIEIDSEYSLCNGGFPIGKTIESDIVTFSFFMQGVLEFNGSFGHITREGKFKLLTMEWYDKDPARVVTDDTRKPPTNYNDTPTWGIGGIDVYDRNNVLKFYVRNTTKKRPSIYVMLDPWVLADRDEGNAYVQSALARLQNVIYHTNYTPSETECSGDLCVEVGDRLDVRFNQRGEYDTRNKFRSYVLERHFRGIQSFRDTYTSKGNLKQPIYQITNGNWHVGDSQNSATSGQGTGGVAELNDEHDRRVIALMRNYGEPMLDEPVVDLVYNKTEGQVEIKWTDPADITSYSPLPIEWAGTEVVRKEGSAPLHGWSSVDTEYGGIVLVTSTTRDEYSETAYVDDTIEPNKRYYYAIRPYYIKLDDADHPIKQYRWTKIISVDTQRIIEAPTILSDIITVDHTSVTLWYFIPVLETGSYSYIKLVAKKDNIPTSVTDGDKIITLEEPQSVTRLGTVTVTGLDELSQYFFVIFVEDDSGMTASSEAVGCMTEETLIPPELQPYVDLLASYGVGLNQTSSLLDCQNYQGNSNTVSMEGYSVCIAGNFNVNGNQYDFYVMDNCEISVTTDDNSASVAYSCVMAPYDTIQTWGRSMWGPYSESGNHIDYLALGTWVPAVPMSFYRPYNVDTVGINFTTSFNSMLECMQYLTAHFRRCNLKVNGNDWLVV